MKLLYLAVVVTSLVCVSGYSVAADSTSFSTRYGTLAFGADGVLAFKGQPVSPEVMYDPYAFDKPIARFSIDASDVFS